MEKSSFYRLIFKHIPLSIVAYKEKTYSRPTEVRNPLIEMCKMVPRVYVCGNRHLMCPNIAENQWQIRVLCKNVSSQGLIL